MDEHVPVPHAIYPESLASKLRLIADLRERLVHVKWGQEPFVLLARVARDTAQTARKHDGCENLAGLAEQLERHIIGFISAGVLPQGPERDRLMVVLDSLASCRAEVDSTEAEMTEVVATDGASGDTNHEVMVVTPDDAGLMITKLRDAGMHPRHCVSLDEARAALAQHTPAAMVIDMDFPGEPLGGPLMVAEARASSALSLPVFFVAENGDLSTRLEAVSAGATGFFTKPVDADAILDRLNDWLSHEAARGYRVLIVDDSPKEARELSRMLETIGVVTRVLTQPMQLLQVLHRFQPDLLLLDLDLKEVGGVELAKIIRQHQAWGDLAMILLTNRGDLSRHLSALGSGVDDLLSKPVAENRLLWAVTHRLRRARALHQRLSSLSHKDPVSGLFNRQYFLTQLDNAMSEAGRSPIAVMIILLNNLRALQEASGVAVADQIVAQAARRVQVAVGAGRQIARFGDATFAVLIKGADGQGLLGTARAVHHAIVAESYQVGDSSVLMRASIGVSVAHDKGRDTAALVQQADMACRLARESGNEPICLKHAKDDPQVTEQYQRRLLAEIEESIENERLGLVFQPTVSLRGDHAERYEVLVRIRNSEGLELVPETVFGLAQRHPVGIALDRWVIARALEQLHRRRADDRPLALFVNISCATLQDPSMVTWLERALSEQGVSAEDLVFEIAETSAEQHIGALQRFLQGVKPLGCGFSLDRFGYRSSSLELVSQLQVDYVKLDAHFVYDLMGDPQKQQRLRKVVGELARQQIIAIASGIENISTLSLLWSCGINYVQGYLLQRPKETLDFDFAAGIP